MEGVADIYLMTSQFVQLLNQFVAAKGSIGSPNSALRRRYFRLVAAPLACYSDRHQVMPSV